jgi:hypothetical protein
LATLSVYWLRADSKTYLIFFSFLLYVLAMFYISTQRESLLGNCIN